LAKMTSRSRFGAFVYTVAPLWTDMGAQECTQIGGNGSSATVLRYSCTLLRREDRTSCDASRIGWHECLNHHGVPAAPPRWPLPLGQKDRP